MKSKLLIKLSFNLVFLINQALLENYRSFFANKLLSTYIVKTDYSSCPEWCSPVGKLPTPLLTVNEDSRYSRKGESLESRRDQPWNGCADTSLLSSVWRVRPSIPAKRFFEGGVERLTLQLTHITYD